MEKEEYNYEGLNLNGDACTCVVRQQNKPITTRNRFY